MKHILLFIFAVLILFGPKNAFADDEIDLDISKLFDYPMHEGYSSFQGFAVTKDYIVISSISNANPNTIISIFDKKTFAHIRDISKYNFGHSNDMAYIEDKNEIYIIDGKKIYVLDLTNFERKEDIVLDTSYYAIAYDNDLKRLYLSDANIVDIYDEKFDKIFSFYTKNNQTGQGTTYENKFYYFAYYENGFPSHFQLIYDGKYPAGSNIIYVYNRGSLVKTLYLKPGYGEIEGVEFYDSKLYCIFNNFEKRTVEVYVMNVKDAENEVEITIPIITSDSNFNSRAELYDDDNNYVETVYSSVTNKIRRYTFSKIHFSDAKKRRYTIKQIKDIEIVDDTPLEVFLIPKYNPIKEKYEYIVEYSNNYFLNIDKKKVKCKEINNIYFDKDGNITSAEEYEIKCNNSSNENNYSLIIVATIIIISFAFAYLFVSKEEKDDL